MELLAPAGTWAGFKAVLAQKPDVIYLGAGSLNARSEEAQFAVDDLPDLVAQARLQGTKIHFTLNILIKDSEMAQALELADQAYQAGVAAVIVQDKGLMQALRQKLPQLSLHASTQCSVGSRAQIEELQDLGVQRIVLARELSLAQIGDLTAYAHSRGLEVEVFVHGATCMSISGQCHLSFCRGGRSANRGACAQPCRLSYKLWKNNRPVRGASACLSPKDLSYFPHLKDLADLGVDSLKIEGRLRRPEYQAQVTAIFKQTLAELDQGLSPSEQVTTERARDLAIAFNRGGGFQASFLRDQRDSDFLSADQVGHYGYYLGQVTAIKDRQGILVYRPESTDPLVGKASKRAERPTSPIQWEQGAWTGLADPAYLPSPGSQISLKNNEGVSVASAPVGVVRPTKIGQEVEIQGFHPRVLRKLRLPLTVWQQKQDRVADQDLRDQATPAKEDLRMRLLPAGLADSSHYLLELSTASKSLTFSSADLDPPPQDTGSPLSLDRIRQQLGKLGQTPYRLASLETSLAPADLPPWRISDLNAFRRAALAKFEEVAACSTEATSLDTAAAGNDPSNDRNAQSDYRNSHSNYQQQLGYSTQENQGERFVAVSANQIEKIIYLPNYQAGDDLSNLQGQADELYILPLEEVCLAASLAPLQPKLGLASWGAYIAPLQAWSLDPSLATSQKAGLAPSLEAKQENCPKPSLESCLAERLADLIRQGLRALVSPTSGLVELVRQSGLAPELAQQVGLYLWQGAQITNRESYEFLAARGYQGLMLSPELSPASQENLAASCMAAGQQNARPILLVSGPLEAMFTRFCPIGYSRGIEACGLCRRGQQGTNVQATCISEDEAQSISPSRGSSDKVYRPSAKGQVGAGESNEDTSYTDADYSLEDEDGRHFPLTPKAWADCSLQIWADSSLAWQPHVPCIRGLNYLESDYTRLRELLDNL